MIEQILSNPKYLHAAQRMRDALNPVQGSRRAVEIIEMIVRTSQPVLVLEDAKTSDHKVVMTLRRTSNPRPPQRYN